MRQPKGAPSAPLYGEREQELWTCTGCGKQLPIYVPAAKTAYPHTACLNTPKGAYQP